MAFVPSLFAHGKREKECCSLWDTLNGNVTAFIVHRLNDVVIKIKLTFGTHYNIPKKTHISDFSYDEHYQNDAVL